MNLEINTLLNESKEHNTGVVDINSIIKNAGYTIMHKEAVLSTYIALQKRIGQPIDCSFVERLYLHDTDKIYLYTLLEKKEASKFHKKYSVHHAGNWDKGSNTKYNILEAFIDYESARFTKADKQMNCYETILAKRPHVMPLFKDLLDMYDLNSPERVKLNLEDLDNSIKEYYIKKNLSILEKLWNNQNIEENLIWFNSVI